MLLTARRVVTVAAAALAITALATPQSALGAPKSPYPWHTRIVATTFWVGEIFDAKAEDGSQELSTYDGKWFAHYGGCDGTVVAAQCRTEKRVASNGYFPRTMTPKENPFYLDLPYDDLNDSAAYARRGDVIPWASAARYAKNVHNDSKSLLKNRWVQLKKGSHVCYGQVEDAGPGKYNDAAYVFGSTNARPKNTRYGGAGMDVSPALNGCLRFAELDGDTDTVSWRFIAGSQVPAGPWRTVITRSGVTG